ncbi:MULTISPECIES: glycosyltransferase [Stenotrophomonas]|uniref:glycosyltransferase n=1 Tax=Stenotrophomonas TaxID=40323 RepID=UPI0021C5813D|nr:MULTISPECIES: glycosyltransferase [Stenotrophomonas]MCU1000471.1 glycosyltransferase [Stenotrophomonas maltophilia]MCU1065508.1 glycosyltransferase [Stenotrophomonas maltophilia]MCU1075864.1 glycosyltransferase [Stenotrophomonas maltophilia]MCU1140519.1 glycosyltransferase [Stenotrophomonas maltophilia]
MTKVDEAAGIYGNGKEALRILVCAHDFHPIQSPQSIRVTQLVSELANRGHDVQVMTRTRGAGAAWTDNPLGIQVHRTSPGGMESIIDAASRVKRRLRPTKASTGHFAPSMPTTTSEGLNWKGRTVAWLRSMLDAGVFPDGRSRWVRGAIRRGRALLRSWSPHVIIGSHEPAAGLMVASSLSRISGIPFIAELGDPVLTSYTPQRWKNASLELERQVCRGAAEIVVTSEATASLLHARHGPLIAPCSVIPQGFPAAVSGMPDVVRASGGMAMVYTGRFYPFRDPMPLVRAVLATPGCTLTIAGPGLPPELAAAREMHPDVLRFVGSLSHAQSLELQRGADVLINIGNAGMTQIPGKLLEYLGSGRPVLHLQPDATDPAAAIIRKENCGFVAPLDEAAIAALLRELGERKQQGQLDAGLRLGPEAFFEYRWDRLAVRLEAVCRRAIGSGQRQA